MNDNKLQRSFDLEKLIGWQEKPPIFELGEPLFWGRCQKEGKING